MDEKIQIPENISLIPLTAKVTVEMLREQVSSGSIYALDYQIYGDDYAPPVEKWSELRSRDGMLLGFHRNGIINLDHHADHSEMERAFSTTNAIITFVKEHGLVTNTPILIHHTDCDSTLSSLILSGALSPDDQFGEAAIAADHTGAINEIADLLQALENKRDLQYSAGQLHCLLRGSALNAESQNLLDQRRREREHAKAVSFKDIGDGVYLGQSNQSVEGAFFPALHPSARIIVYASPYKETTRWYVRIRAGQRWPEGASINKLQLPDFGGRWNAGSTGRGCGTSFTPRAYAELVRNRLRTVYGSQLAD
ncbi:hypothetical protein MYX07_06485 [Patescibacteria group bacterium AH-259-L07]|nr:hypothetical protein [Patescibacteria group bacterium AH-259-L07]